MIKARHMIRFLGGSLLLLILIMSCLKPQDTPELTNHIFTWSTDTLGLRNSRINDVAVVSENDIWVVGQFNLPDPDSSYDGSGIERFSIALWDNIGWQFKSVRFGSEVQSIHYFDENDIWVCSYNPVHWNGEEWTYHHLEGMGVISEGYVTELWGNASNDMYFAGTKGVLVHYDGTMFTKINTNTMITLSSIVGDESGSIVATGVNGYGISGSVILKYDGLGVDIPYERGEYQTSLYGNVLAAGYNYNQFLAGCNFGLLEYEPNSGNIELNGNDVLNWDHYGNIRSIEAQASNDVVLVSTWGSLNYFNGEEWNSNLGIEEVIQTDGSFQAEGVDYNQDIIAVGGWSVHTREAILVIGKDNVVY